LFKRVIRERICIPTDENSSYGSARL
jgi:hypothetical protein